MVQFIRKILSEILRIRQHARSRYFSQEANQHNAPMFRGTNANMLLPGTFSYATLLGNLASRVFFAKSLLAHLISFIFSLSSSFCRCFSFHPVLNAAFKALHPSETLVWDSFSRTEFVALFESTFGSGSVGAPGMSFGCPCVAE